MILAIPENNLVLITKKFTISTVIEYLFVL